MYKELNGVVASKHIKQELLEQVKELVNQGHRPPHLAAILVGEDGASQTYVKMKQKACAAVGFESTLIRYENTLTEEELVKKIEELNEDEQIDGILVQLPLPKQIDESTITETISPAKDVDGFHNQNVGMLAKGKPGFVSATPLGVTKMIEFYGLETSGKHCVIIGRSNIVGRPMSLLMSMNAPYGNATVTLCHSRTKDIGRFCRMADILIVALGIPGFVTEDMVKEGAIVIDVGITRVDTTENEKGYVLKGDVDFHNVAEKTSAITPVPRGVGPMTIVGLLENTLKAYKQNHNISL